jgi:cytoskeleton protein RodZ
MSQLGERLRQARESQGISLAQASQETRILQRYLVALEEGDLAHLPGDVYARGFIRNYSSYLGLPAEDVIALYRHERGMSDAIKIVPAATAPRMRPYVLPNFLGVFFITVALLGLSYIGLSALGRIGNSNDLAVAPSPTVPPPTPLPTVSSIGVTQIAVIPTAAPTSAPTTQPTQLIAGFGITPVPTATPPTPIVVLVSIRPNTGGSWLRVQQDGTIVFEGVLKAGQSQTFQAQSKIIIRSGNPGAVRVNVNGTGDQPIGPGGKPVNWEYPPQQ